MTAQEIRNDKGDISGEVKISPTKKRQNKVCIDERLGLTTSLSDNKV